MQFDLKDEKDPKIKNAYKLYKFKKETISQAPQVSGVFVLFDEMLEVLYIGRAKNKKMQEEFQNIIKNPPCNNIKFRQIFETETEEAAKELEEEWKEKYRLPISK